MDDFPSKTKQNYKITQETHSMNKPITIKQIGYVIKELPLERTTGYIKYKKQIFSVLNFSSARKLSI